MDRVKRIWYLSHMRAAKVQASLRIRAVSPEPSLLAQTSSESRGTFRQKARSLAPLNGWVCAVKICHDGMLKDTNSLDGAQMKFISYIYTMSFHCFVHYLWSFGVTLVKEAVKKSYKLTCLVITFTSRRHNMTSVERHVWHVQNRFIEGNCCRV